MKLENIIYCGDNLTWLKKFPDKCIDLIYLDPPFFSNKHYEVIFNDGEEIRSFEDRWKGGINHYIGWMRDRVFELHRVLKDTGSFYLHCDWHAGHYLKVMCDNIFGYNKFRNEIVWHYDIGNAPKKDLKRKHDTILRYSKTSNYVYNTIIIETRNKERYNQVNENGRRFFARGDTGKKCYMDEGAPCEDVWTFVEDDKLRTLNSMARERLGYPTQKPEALMERIIKASSNKDDLILDPFCGCGTTIAVAQRLQRKWIGIDVSPSACKLMKNRVEKNGARGIEIIGQPLNIEELKALPPFEFQNWCVGAMGGTVSLKKVGDMGIDGYTFMYRYPIQVKQSEKVDRITVDKFETALLRVKHDIGYIIAFSFGKGAYEEVARAKKQGLHIELLAVDKLLEYEEEAKQGKIL